MTIKDLKAVIATLPDTMEIKIEFYDSEDGLVTSYTDTCTVLGNNLIISN